MLKIRTSILKFSVASILLTAACQAQNVNLPPLPAQQDIPQAGPETDGPYQPTAIIPGGTVVTLFPPDSPYLKQERVHEAESYRSYSPPNLGYVVNIHNPSIEFHSAKSGPNTGACVILAAGGGHNNLNLVGEGADVVPFLQSQGISAVILRNRLRSDGYDPKTDGIHDAMQAIKVVRAYADQWGLDPNKIGIVGFSAGAELAAAAAIYYEEFDEKNNTADNPFASYSARPDFVGSIYPGPSPFAFGGEAVIPRAHPPVFFATPGWGDWIHAVWADDYFTALHNDGVPNCEIHIYARGVHPGDRSQPEQPPATSGITRRNGAAFGVWQDRFTHWLSDLGFMGPAGEETQAAKDIAASLDRPHRMNQMMERIRARREAQKQEAAQ